MTLAREMAFLVTVPPHALAAGLGAQVQGWCGTD